MLPPPEDLEPSNENTNSYWSWSLYNLFLRKNMLFITLLSKISLLKSNVTFYSSTQYFNGWICVKRNKKIY